jgi:hypothetical protein
VKGREGWRERKGEVNALTLHKDRGRGKQEDWPEVGGQTGLMKF